MSEARGQFHWYELQTPDPAAAGRFYQAVVGWTTSSGGPEYTLLNTAKGGVGGMMMMPPSEGPARWMGYVAVADVDAMAKDLTAAGGSIRIPPVDVPGMLRFIGVADPQGTPFVIYTGFASEGPPQGRAGERGYAGWHELVAEDGAKAFDFYGGLFGWTRTAGHDMGPMGLYQLWSDGRDGDQGGMMTRPEGAPGPVWNFYFNVEGIDAAVERLTQAGGTVTNGPHQVPGGNWIVQGVDPQGAAFSLVSLTK